VVMFALNCFFVATDQESSSSLVLVVSIELFGDCCWCWCSSVMYVIMKHVICTF
jgi:hypothetical protein